MKKALLALVLVGAVTAGVIWQVRAKDKRPRLSVTIPLLPWPEPELRMYDMRLGSQKSYMLEVRSRHDRALDLEAELGNTDTKLVMQLRGDTRILPEGRGRARLVLAVPPTLGAFENTVTIRCPQLPDWKLEYKILGSVVDKPFDGAYMFARPAGVRIGAVEAGSHTPVVVALVNRGTVAIEVREVIVSDRDRLRVKGLIGGAVIVPGAELQLDGVYVAGSEPGPFRERVRVMSNAVNTPDGLDLIVTGEVVTPYSPAPLKFLQRSAYPHREPRYQVRIHAREGSAPFTVTDISGHESALDVVDRGSDTPADVQVVTFKLRRDAPPALERPLKLRVRLTLSVGYVVTWPMTLRILPIIRPHPPRLNFGVVEQGTPKAITIRLLAAGGRRFKAISASSQRGTVHTQVWGAAGMEQSIIVNVKPGLPGGPHSDVVIVKTDDKDVPEIRVPVSIQIR